MSLQQVNLLTEELIPPKQWLTANQLLVTTGVFALGLMAFSGLDSLNLPKLYDIESRKPNFVFHRRRRNQDCWQTIASFLRGHGQRRKLHRFRIQSQS